MSVGAKGIGSFGFKTADNSLTCDSVGNCMLKDELLVGPQWTHGLTDDLAAADKDNFGMNFGVKGMTCGGCVSKLQAKLDKAPGVNSAIVTLEPGRATITGTLSEADLSELVTQAGFTPS